MTRFQTLLLFMLCSSNLSMTKVQYLTYPLT